MEITNVHLITARTAAEFEEGKKLFEEYAASLSFDLGYQDFKKELDTIARQYREPAGALLLCFVNDEYAGCTGVRNFAEGVAELKRLYVKPGYRNFKIGKRLLEAAVAAAQRMHYQFIRLDTVPEQSRAQLLYRQLGFYEIAAYRYSPIDGTIYFEKKLD